MEDLLTKQQDVVYEILAGFHDFCVEHNLLYYLAYGTLLGAVRHEGFIPWDDDVDVLMPRKDYDKLISLAEELPFPLELNYYKNSKYSLTMFAKVVNSNTTIVSIRDWLPPLLGGLYIDIFPLDGMGNVYKKSIKTAKSLNSLARLQAASCYKLKYKGKKKDFWKIPIIILANIIGTKKIRSKIEKKLKKLDYDNSEYVTSAFGAYGKRNLMPKSFFGTPLKLKFKDKYFYAPQETDKYLTSLYGDYMQLPPVEKRVIPHSKDYISFDTSYNDFDMKEYNKTKK